MIVVCEQVKLTARVKEKIVISMWEHLPPGPTITLKCNDLPCDDYSG